MTRVGDQTGCHLQTGEVESNESSGFEHTSLDYA